MRSPHISLMECMASCGAPTSMVRQPRLLARIGPACIHNGQDMAHAAKTRAHVEAVLIRAAHAPIVDPQAMSLRTANSWVGMSRLRATSLHRASGSLSWYFLVAGMTVAHNAGGYTAISDLKRAAETAFVA